MATPPPDTCWTTLRAASAGDRSAKSLFAHSYTTPIRAYLSHRWRDTPLADATDDAVQEVFVECLKPGGVLARADQERGDFRALLYGVTRNVARRFEQRAARPDHRQPAESVYLDDLPAQAWRATVRPRHSVSGAGRPGLRRHVLHLDGRWLGQICRTGGHRPAGAEAHGDPERPRTSQVGRCAGQARAAQRWPRLAELGLVGTRRGVLAASQPAGSWRSG